MTSWEEQIPGVLVPNRGGKVVDVRRLPVQAPGRSANFGDAHYACNERKLFKSVNGGVSWSMEAMLPDSTDFCLSLAVTDRVVYVGTQRGLYEAPPEKITSISLSADPSLQSASITDLLTGKAGEIFTNVIFNFQGEQTFASFMRSSPFEPWRQVQFPEQDTSVFTGHRIVGWVDGELFASSSKGVIGSRDGGKSWTPSQPGISSVRSANMIIVQGDGEGNLYANARETVWKRLKGERQWKAISLTSAGFEQTKKKE